MKKFVGYDLANAYINGSDVRIDRRDGTSVVIVGDSFDISKDPVTGKTRDGADVSIFEADINNVVRV